MRLPCLASCPRRSTRPCRAPSPPSPACISPLPRQQAGLWLEWSRYRRYAGACASPSAGCPNTCVPLRRGTCGRRSPMPGSRSSLAARTWASWWPGCPCGWGGAWLATVNCGRVAPTTIADGDLQRAALTLRIGLPELQAILAQMPAFDEADFRLRVAHVATAVEGVSRLLEARAAEQRTQRALEAINRRLGALGAIASSIMRSPELEGSLAEALHTIVDVLQLDGGAIFLRSEDDGSLLLAAHLGVSPEFTAAGDLIADLLHGSLEPWVVPDVVQAPELPLGAPQQWRFGAFVAAPLRAAAQTLGALTVHAVSPRPFRPDEGRAHRRRGGAGGYRCARAAPARG